MLRFLPRAFAAALLLILCPGPAPAGENPLVFGLLLVGSKTDEGYSQAEYEGGRYVEEHFPGARMLLEEKINAADRPEASIPHLVDKMAAKGAKLIFAGSEDMRDEILKAARQHPDIAFIHISGDDALTGSAPPNLGNLFGRIEYAKMLAGFAAALTTHTGHIGYLGPLINDETRRIANAAYLGARYAWDKVLGKPADELRFTVKWIGFWFNIPGATDDPTKVAEGLFNQGCDVLLSGLDTREALTVAYRRHTAGERVFAVPYLYKNACAGMEEACLGAPYFNWGPAFLSVVQQVADKDWAPSFDWLYPDFADMNNPDVSTVGLQMGKALPPTVRARLAQFIADLGSGRVDLYADLRYQDGSVYIPAGRKALDKEIWRAAQLLEGMEGASAPR